MPLGMNDWIGVAVPFSTSLVSLSRSIALDSASRTSALSSGALLLLYATQVVPSLGYHLVRRKRRLAPGLAGLDGRELVALRERGVATAEVVEEMWLSYCGDTGAAVFDLTPALFDSRILMLECTFLGDEQRGSGDRYKHLHLEDIERRADRFHNQAIVLHHLSRRHRQDDLRAEIERRLPALAPRIHLLIEGVAR